MSSSTAFHVPCATDESSGRLVAGPEANLPPAPGLPATGAHGSVSFGGGGTPPSLWDWLLSVLSGGKNG